jgi:hypothetical protein
VSIRPGGAKRARCGFDRQDAQRYRLARQIVDGRDEMPHDVLRAEQLIEGGVTEQPREQLVQRSIAFGQRRQRARRRGLDRMLDTRLGIRARCDLGGGRWSLLLRLDAQLPEIVDRCRGGDQRAEEQWKSPAHRRLCRP